MILRARAAARVAVRGRALYSSISTKSISDERGDEFQEKIAFYDDGGVQISPWHDVPLFPEGKNGGDGDGLVHFINEIPRFSRPKMEVDTKGKLNCIEQDTSGGLPRLYHGPLYWNYGCLPQTWEDPEVGGGVDVNGAKGDNDPLDVVEIGTRTMAPGEISIVKVIAALALIDGDELDYKLIVVNANDANAMNIKGADDIPHVISGIREWFRWYKTPDNKPINGYGFNGDALSKSKAFDIILETNEHWRYLVENGARAKQLGLWVPAEE